MQEAVLDHTFVSSDLNNYVNGQFIEKIAESAINGLLASESTSSCTLWPMVMILMFSYTE